MQEKLCGKAATQNGQLLIEIADNEHDRFDGNYLPYRLSLHGT